MNETPALEAASVTSSRGRPLQFPCGETPQAGQASEIAPGILWLPIPLPQAGQFINAWGVRDGDGWTLIDTGMFTEPAQAAWRAILAAGGPLNGQQVTGVICTHLHADHVGMAGWLCREFGCELWMTRAEFQQGKLTQSYFGQPVSQAELAFFQRAGWQAQELAQYRPMGRHMFPMPEWYRRIEDGQRVHIGGDSWLVVVGNGHSPEHACLYCPERRLFLSGDQVLPSISSNVSVHPVEPHANPVSDWLNSIEKLKKVVADDVLVLPAHGSPFIGLHARLDALAEKRYRSLDRLRARLRQAPGRAVDALESLFGRDQFASIFQKQLATGEAVAYLNYLVAREEVEVSEDAQFCAWYRLRS